MIQVYKATSCHSKSAEIDLNVFLSEHKDYKIIDIKPYPNDGNVNGCALLLMYEVQDKSEINNKSSKKFKVSFIVETTESNYMKKDEKAIVSTTGTMLDEFFEINKFEIEEINDGR